ncbi:MAG: V-type ATP synthase subunit I, partial [Lachnospiraceae bacterium]
PIEVRHADTGHIFDIMITAFRGADSAFVRIVDYHTNVVSVKRNDTVVLEREITECKGTLLKDRNQIESLRPWVNLDVPMDFAGTKTTGVLIGTVPGTRTEEEIYAAVYTAFAVEKAKLAEAEKTGNAQNPPEAAFAEAEGKAAGKTGATKTGNAAKATERTQNASFANAEHPVSVEMLFSENDSTGICVLFLKRDAETVAEGLRKIGFARPSQPESAVPAEQISLLEADMEKTEGKIAELTGEIGKYAGERERLRAVSDYYRTRAEKYKFLGTIPQSEEVFFFEGWVPEPQAERVQKLLTEKYDAIVEVEDPPEGMVTPTLLKNNKFSASVEGVLESYGLPQKGRVDPTFVMSIFYVFFFGMMLSDAGYGLVMSVACGIILLKYKRMDTGLRRAISLFFWCGLSTIFWGLMYGGFFGDAIDVIAKTYFGYTGDGILKALWFEPLTNPMVLLIWCLLFGVIHLFMGLALKGYEALRDKDYVSFFADVIAWYMLLIGLILMLLPSDLFASIAGMTFSFPPFVNTLAIVLAIAGAVVILFMAGRTSKNFIIRIALGAYDIYGITSWLSDVLSYSRLLALGLATGVIASVINMMAAMVGGSGFLGPILFIIVFLLGHTLNIGINALGAYVHTNRLQFVEFFGKFYDGGGKKFAPFQTANKYIEIKEEK